METRSQTVAKKKKKETIPLWLKRKVWEERIGKTYIGICPWCKESKLTPFEFHASHIVSEKNGGKATLENLVAMCGPCNMSIGSKDLIPYSKECNVTFVVVSLSSPSSSSEQEATKTIISSTKEEKVPVVTPQSETTINNNKMREKTTAGEQKKTTLSTSYTTFWEKLQKSCNE